MSYALTPARPLSITLTPDSHAQLTLSLEVVGAYYLEYATNLAEPYWTFWIRFTQGAAPLVLMDSHSITNGLQRFYRVRPVPKN